MSGDKNGITTITFSTEKYSNSSLYKLNNGEYCQNIINIQADLPKIQPDTLHLDSIYYSIIFNIDTKFSSSEELLTQYSNNLKADYGKESPATKSNSSKISYHHNTNINITPVYNKNNLLSILKRVIIINNTDTASVNNSYYNIDLATGRQLTVSEIIADENMKIIHQLLVDNLLKQLEISNEYELADFGYFDTTNIIATDNFYYTDEGIVWSYPTYEIACYAVGETDILVTYNQLESILKNN